MTIKEEYEIAKTLIGKKISNFSIPVTKVEAFLAPRGTSLSVDQKIADEGYCVAVFAEACSTPFRMRMLEEVAAKEKNEDNFQIYQFCDRVEEVTVIKDRNSGECGQKQIWITKNGKRLRYS